MPIQVVTRWQIGHEDASRILRDAAPLVRNHGATAIQIGRITTGQHVNQTTIAVTYPDWATFGRAVQLQHEDSNYQQKYAEALKAGQLMNRSIVAMEDIT